MHLLALLGLLAFGPQTNCNRPATESVTYVQLPGRPFEPIPSADGCWIFVSMLGDVLHPQPGIGVVRRSGGRLTLERVISCPEMLTGMTLTHNGKLLIAGIGNGVLFLDPARLISGRGEPVLGVIRTSAEKPSASYVSVTKDDRFLFVSNESSGTISVINVDTREIIGSVTVGIAPIAVTLSEDEKYLYSTSEIAPGSYNFPATCEAKSLGAITILDVSRAETDPANSVVSKAAAGCSPVRLVLSSIGDTAYVTARGDNVVLVFDTRKLMTDPEHAQMGKINVGIAPVGIALVNGGRKIIVANSNRFSRDPGARTLSVIENGSVTSVIPAGIFPREIRVTADDRTLLVTNFGSKSLEIVDLDRLPLKSYSGGN